MSLSLEIFEKSLQSLNDALHPPPQHDRERDGAIQRFEYTFEQAWKVGKKVLEDYGVLSNSPKSVIRDLAQQGWIQNPEQWLIFLKARNYTTHTYSEKAAEYVFNQAKLFAEECKKYFEVLKNLQKK